MFILERLKENQDQKRFAAWLFAGVFASRALTSTSAYFADGPRHLAAIQTHVYVITPPGYWLFHRVASLFPDAELAILVMNWFFSAAGAVVFYLVARKITSEVVARVSSIAYAAVFFAWFSGNIHSTYASQLFFPVAVFLCFLSYSEHSKFGWLVAAGILFAVGAGFRPSDGAFFAPAFLYGLSRCRVKHALVCLAIVFPVCLAWLIPQQVALYKSGLLSLGGELREHADGVLMTGLSPYALANVLRVILPLSLGLFPLYGLIFGNRKCVFFWVWVLPGIAFFLLVYIADATYFDYLLPGLLLLAATQATASDRRKVHLFSACAALNLILYFGWRPITFKDYRLQLAEYVIHSDVGKFTFHSVQHHDYRGLAALLHKPGFQGKESVRAQR